MSKLERMLLMHLQVAGMPMPECEYRFAMHHVGAGRGIRDRLLKAGLKDWRADFAWPSSMLLVECEGIVWSGKGGRHQRGDGFEEDLKKYQAAMRLGFNVYRCSAAMIKSGDALKTIEILLDREERRGEACAI